MFKVNITNCSYIQSGDYTVYSIQQQGIDSIKFLIFTDKFILVSSRYCTPINE